MGNASSRRQAKTVAVILILSTCILLSLRMGWYPHALVSDNHLRPKSLVASLGFSVCGNSSSSSNATFFSARFATTPDLREPFEQLLTATTESAQKLGVFRNIYSMSQMPDWVKSDMTWKRHLKFLQNSNDVSKRGAGYWFWKAVLTSRLLEEKIVEENSILVYTDPDRQVAAMGTIEWEKLLKTMEIFDIAVVNMDGTYDEESYTKADVLDYF